MIRISQKTLRLRKEKILPALRGISLETAKVLLVMARDKNPVVGTNDLRKIIPYKENELGGILRAITSIKIEGRQLVERLPLKTDRNNSHYLWNDDASSRTDVALVLEDVLNLYK